MHPELERARSTMASSTPEEVVAELGIPADCVFSHGAVATVEAAVRYTLDFLQSKIWQHSAR